MKLLLDENLSWRLVKKLSNVFSKVIHVSSLPLNKPASDISIWNFAKSEGYTIVSKDDDFEKLVLLKKAPPKFIFLKTFNLDTNNIAHLIIGNKDIITTFLNSKENDILEIYST